MTRFVKKINDSPLAAERAEKDILGNKIDTTYQHTLTAGSNISINNITRTSFLCNDTNSMFTIARRPV